AVSITIGVISSLLVSILLLPPLYTLIYRVGKRESELEVRSMVNVTKWYENGLGVVFRFPKWTVVAVTVLFISSVFLFGLLTKERLPPISRDDCELTIDWNESISLQENEARVLDLIRAAGSDITVANAWIGNQQYLFMNDVHLGYKEAMIYVKAAGSKEVE